MIELRWYRYARALSNVLQFRVQNRDGWSEWETVPMVFENDGWPDR